MYSLSQLWGALATLNRAGIITLPGGQLPIYWISAGYGQQARVIGETEYAALEWRTEGDPKASPKPTWAVITEQVRRSALNRRVKDEEWYPASLEGAVDRASNTPVPLNVGTVHVGKGISHMASLIHHVDEAGKTGVVHRPQVLRTSTHRTAKTLFTEEETRQFLSLVAAARSRAESANNIVRVKIQPFLETMTDQNGGLAESATPLEKIEAREAAQASVQAILDDVDREFEIALASLDSLEPSDLETARVFWSERAGAYAGERSSEIRNVVGTADNTLHAACTEQETALREVSQALVGVRTGISRAKTVVSVKELVEGFKGTLRAIRPINTPVWKRGDTEIALGTDGTHALNVSWTWANDLVSYRAVTLDSINPSPSPPRTVEELGNVAVRRKTVPDGWFVAVGTVPGKSSAYRANIEYKPGGRVAPIAGDYVFELVANNNCGAVPITLTISVSV